MKSLLTHPASHPTVMARSTALTTLLCSVGALVALGWPVIVPLVRWFAEAFGISW